MNGSNYLLWGDQKIHLRHATEHFLVLGASGSGKTTLIEILLQSIAGNDQFQSLIYDPKQEIVPHLFNVKGVTEDGVFEADPRVRILHPLDRRCSSWNIAEDITGPINARQFATILVPDKGANEKESFFDNAVRDLLTGVILAFIRCVPAERTWTFRDVLLTMLYEPCLRFVLGLERTREGDLFPILNRLRETYVNPDPKKSDPRTIHNIRASINAKLSIYEPIAASWAAVEKDPNRRFSLTQWVAEGRNQTLILGNDESARTAIDAINQALFKRATELILARPERERTEINAGKNLIWIVLDEVREAGELDGLSRLLTKGRSKGAAVVMGFQDIEGMRSVYGQEVANEIAGQCNNIAVLRLNSPTTAQWASDLFGRRLTERVGRNRTLGSEGSIQISREVGEDEQPYLYTSDFLYLPQANPRDGLQGFFRSPEINPETDLRVCLSWESFVQQSRFKSVETAHGSWNAPFLSIQTELEYLQRWTPDDLRRLGFDDVVAKNVLAVADEPYIPPDLGELI